MAFADVAPLLATLNLGGNFSRNLSAASRQLKTFDADLTKSQSRATQAGVQIGTGIKNAAKLAVGATAILGTAVAAVSIKSVKLAGDFEAQLNVINTIAHTGAANLTTIGNGIRKIATDTGASLDDLTAGYYDLLSAGIKTADAQKVLAQANTLAIGGLSTTAEAVDLLTTAINVYGGGATEAAKYTDEFAKAIERGKVTAADLAASYSQVAPLAKSLGVSSAELAAGFARLTASGTSAGEASTQMASALSALLKKTPELEKLEAKLHKNYAAIAGSQGLNVALEQLRTDAGKAGLSITDLVGRKEALLYILQTTGPNLAAYNADLLAMGKASGTAAAQMAERQQGLNFQLARLRALAKDAGITIGSALLPKITPLIEKLNQFVSGNQAGIAAFGEKIAALFSDANISQGAAILTQMFRTAQEVAPAIAASAKITGEVIKTAVNLFNSLPPEIKGLAIAGLAVNKLTGGLVTNLAGGLISAVISSFRGMMNVNAAVVNVNGGVAGGAPGAIGTVAKGGLLGIAGLTAGTLAFLVTSVLATGAIAHSLLFPTVGDVERRRQGREDTGRARGIPDSHNRAINTGNATNNDVRSQFASNAYLGRSATKAASALDLVAAHARKVGGVFDKSLYEKARALLGYTVEGGHTKGGKNAIQSLATFKGSQLRTLAASLTQSFVHSQAPFYNSSRNQERALRGLQAAQRRAYATGDTKTANALGKDIAALKQRIAGKLDQVRNKIPPKTDLSVTVKNNTSTYVNGRLLGAASTRFKQSYGVGTFGA